MDRITDDDGTRPCAVYRLFDSGGALLYVGMCFNVASRMYRHEKRAKWWGEVAGEPQVTWMANRAAADVAETIAINLEHPKYNFRKHLGLGRELKSKIWLSDLGMEFRCTDVITPRVVAQAAAPRPLAEKIGIAAGAPVLRGACSLVREGRTIAWLSEWVSPLPGSAPAVDRRTGTSSLFAAYAEHRLASSEEAAAIGVETGCPIDAAWRSPEDRSVPGKVRRSVKELVTVCQCPEGAAEPKLELGLEERWDAWRWGGHPRAEVAFRHRNVCAWYCPDCKEMLPSGWRPLRSTIERMAREARVRRPLTGRRVA